MDRVSLEQPVGGRVSVHMPLAGRQPAGGLRELSAQRLVLRHLRTESEIDAVRALRGHINLGVHALVDPHFAAHEKKETSWE